MAEDMLAETETPGAGELDRIKERLGRALNGCAARAGSRSSARRAGASSGHSESGHDVSGYRSGQPAELSGYLSGDCVLVSGMSVNVSGYPSGAITGHTGDT